MSSAPPPKPSSLYIDLLKRVLLNTIYRDPHRAPWGEPVYDPEARRLGRDWPRDAHTMVGEARLDNLEALYPRLSPGGYVIVDDYRAFAPCQRAVENYREKHGIVDEIQDIDWTAAYWRKAG